jgi:hypothetical protein
MGLVVHHLVLVDIPLRILNNLTYLVLVDIALRMVKNIIHLVLVDNLLRMLNKKNIYKNKMG